VALFKEQLSQMSDVFTFFSYRFCLFPAGLRRTQELMNECKIKDWNRGQETELSGRIALRRRKTSLGW
jgi:hypothetical protein